MEPAREPDPADRMQPWGWRVIAVMVGAFAAILLAMFGPQLLFFLVMTVSCSFQPANVCR